MNLYASGKLGDFIQSLIVAKFYSKFYPINLFYGQQFLEGLDLIESFNNLKNLTLKQKYINSFSLYNNEYIDINLTDFRFDKDLNNIGVTDLYKKVYKINEDIKFIDSDFNEKYFDKIIIHRSIYKNNNNFPWRYIIEKYKDSIIFISNNYADFHNFNHMELNFELMKDIYETSIAINSCKMFIGNESMPAVLAHSLDKPRIIEIHNMQHRRHWYPDEIKYSNNINFYYDDEYKKMNLIND